MSKKYCMDCGHYVPGGSEYNCSAAVKVNDRAVSALKEACKMFVDKEGEEEIKFAPIRMRRLKKRRTY